MGHAAHQILVVDDDPDIREALRDIIVDEGWEASTAFDGLDAKQQLDAGLRPCLIVLDIMMPRMSGTELLEYMRSDGEELRNLPVIVLTAGIDPKAPGAQRVLHKPVPLKAMLDEIERHCGQ